MTAVATPLSTARLLGPATQDSRAELRYHLEAHGPLPAPGRWSPEWAEQFLTEVERSGLSGRGGAGFPSYRKMRAVYSAGRGPAIIANAMEGEPASAKDRALLRASPHLVIDGAELVARALGASRVVVCLPDDRGAVADHLTRALIERGEAGKAGAAGAAGAPVEIVRLPGRYIAGEESALVRAVGGKPGVPLSRTDKAVPLSLGRHHALVHNVETLAHVALIARYGADWFRELGPPAAPGTCLVTVSGDVRRPGVLEVEIGTPLGDMIGPAGPVDPVQAVLVGGYGGTWVSVSELATAYAPADLGTLGATMGAGVLVVLRAGRCGLRETARITRFMAAESAGQCGPCLFGLPTVADDLEQLADGALGSKASAGADAWDRLARRVDLVVGRGACRHPDGVARLVRSAMRVFASDGDAHSRGRPCPGSGAPTVLRFAGPRSETEPRQP